MARKELKCNPGNYQCGGICQSNNRNCFSNNGASTVEVANKLEQLVKAGQVKQEVADRSFEKLSAMNLTDSEVDAVTALYGSLIEKPEVDRRGFFKPSIEEIEEFKESGRLNDYVQAYNNSVDGQRNVDYDVEGGVGDYVETIVKKKEISDDLANAVYDSLPDGIKKKMNKAGDPRQGFWQKDGTVGSSATRERGVQLTKRYLEQDGIDPYSGKFLDLNDAELEHIIPEENIGSAAENPKNWAWISAKNNKWHSNLTADQWKSSIDSTLANKDAYKRQFERDLKKSQETGKALGGLGEKTQSIIGEDLSTEERMKNADDLSKSLKKKAYKLVGELGGRESFQQPRPDKVDDKGTMRHRTSNVDERVKEMTPFLEDKYGSSKPSELFSRTVAKTSGTPQKDEFINAYNQLMEERSIPKPIAGEIWASGGRSAFNEALKEKDREFAGKFRTLLDQYLG